MPIMREHPGRFPEPTRVLAHNWYNFAIYTNNAGGVRNNVGGVRNWRKMRNVHMVARAGG